MASITIDISDIQFQKLEDLARAQGISPEALLQASLEDSIDSAKSDFTDATSYVLTKNAELYERLA
jgi:antitoxin FitA